MTDKNEIVYSDSDIRTILQEILIELSRTKHRWNVDPIHAAGVVGEESGELQQAAIDFTYNTRDIIGVARLEMYREAKQTAAMAIRFMMYIHDYKPIESERIPIKKERDLRDISKIIGDIERGFDDEKMV